MEPLAHKHSRLCEVDQTEMIKRTSRHGLNYLAVLLTAENSRLVDDLSGGSFPEKLSWKWQTLRITVAFLQVPSAQYLVGSRFGQIV